MSEKEPSKSLLLFQGLSAEDLHFISAALNRDRFEVHGASDWEELTRRAVEDGVALVYLFSESSDEILKSMTQAKGSSKVPWLVGVRSPSRSFLSKAKEVGAAEILVQPYMMGFLIEKIKKHLQLSTQEKKYFEADIKFRLRRKWPKISTKTIADWTTSSADLESRLVHLLQELLREANFAQDELAFGTFGVSSPVISYPSKEFQLLLVNNLASTFHPVKKVGDEPDVRSQSLEGAAFSLTLSPEETLVSLPLFTGQRLHGFLRWRHRGPWSPECDQLAGDIYAYLEEMGPLLRRFDYLSRLGLGIKKEAV